MSPEVHLLVLEDDENLRELLCDTLSDEGYWVQGAASGQEALAKVHQHNFDILLLDVRMEGMSGLEAFACMRQQGVELACLVITGYATEEDSIRAIRLGVGDYLRKPFEMSELLARLARLASLTQVRSRAAQREQRLLQQLYGLCRIQFSSQAWEAAQLAGQIARALQLERHQVLEVELACAWAAQGQRPPDAEHWLAQGLDTWQERWDGSGPQGLAGESIPLAGRIVALALLAQRWGGVPERLAHDFAGVLDPQLLFALELRHCPFLGRRLTRMLDLARGLLASGQSQEGLEILREVEPLAEGPIHMEVQLLLARFEPCALRQPRLQALLDKAQAWGPALGTECCLEAGLLLLEVRPALAAAWIGQALQRPLEPGRRAVAQLACWTLDQGPSPPWSPELALEVLLQPIHHPRLIQHLGWLGSPLLRRWSHFPQLIPKAFLRHFASALLPGLAQLTPQERLALLEHLPQGPPLTWLPWLAQEVEPKLRRVVSRTASEKPPPLHIRSFGSFQVLVAGKPINEKSYRGLRNRAVLALVASSQRPQSEERVRELLWPEELEKGRKGLYNAVFCLRRALRPEGWQGDCDYLVRDKETIGLALELEPWHDLWLVESGLNRARHCGWEELPAQVEAVLTLAQAPYLDGNYLDWASERRLQIDHQVSEVVLLACAQAWERSEWSHLQHWSQRLLERDATNQAAALHAMRAYCHLGRPEEALRLYQGLSKKLEQDYGLEPTTELIEWMTRAKLWV